MTKVGYIGLGIMGSAMAANLLKRGFDLSVWNRTPERAGPLMKRGAVWVDRPADLASCVDVLCLNVTDTPDVESVLFGPGGVAEGARPGLVVLDHSTISPRATRGFADRLARNQVTLLDAPVTGGDVGAREGTLSIMVGGDARAYESVLPVLKAVGRRITHVGPSGQGQLAKACNQILCALNLLGVCEAMALARKGGLDLSTLLDCTTAGAGGSWALEHLGPRIAAGDMEPGFMIDLITKDLAIVCEEGRLEELPLLGTRLVAELFEAAGRMGHGRAGTQALSRVIEALGRFRFQSDSGEGAGA